MDAPVPANVLLFEGFSFDRRAGALFRRDEGGALVPVAVGSRALAVLDTLVARQGDLVSKEEIIDAVWPETVVEENNLTVQISALRRILDRGRTDGSCIQTVPGRGYRFVAPVVRTNSPATPVAVLPSGNGVDEHITVDEPLLSRLGVPARPDEPSSQASRRRPRRGVIAGVIGALLFVAAGLAGWHLRPSGSDQTRPVPRLSIVVLPFANLNNDPDQQYFPDGITEDLTTDLSRIARFVISRNTALIYRNKLIETKQVGRELGVRYVLEGSVERLGNQIRVNARLINAETNAHLWAERFDGDTSDLFTLQSEITSRIAIALGVELTDAEAARPTVHPDALDYLLRGQAAQSKGYTRGSRAEAISMYERALALDPRYAAAQSSLAGVLAARAMDGMADSPAADIARAEGLANQALAAAPSSAGAHYAKGQVLRAQAQVLREEGRCREAIGEYDTAISFNRNFMYPMTDLGYCKLLTGSMEEVIPRMEHAIRLSPRDHAIPIWFLWIGQAHLLQSQIDEATTWLEKARNASPTHPGIRAILASAYALKGETDRAAAELAEARRLSPTDRFSSFARLKAAQYFGVSKVRDLYETTYLRGLRLAGMPEE
jgi:TolB-like protein/DNA-binding winged helix-turn-helix (wHTH) protein/Flp pilus assembly protein TadD